MEPEQRQARETAAEQSGYVEHARAAFRAGWDAAMGYVRERERGLMLIRSDGRYCYHRDDDPTHSAICYRQPL